MEKSKDLSAFIIDYADMEFNGRSFNGNSLMSTLKELDENLASDSRTFEGYSAWEIVHHICYCKLLVLKNLNKILGFSDSNGYMSGLESCPFEFKDFPPMPDNRSKESWQKLLVYLENVHSSCMKVVRDLKPEMLEMILPEWNVKYGNLLAWLFTHDSYHNAQIRNMGLAGLKNKKIGT